MSQHTFITDTFFTPGAIYEGASSFATLFSFLGIIVCFGILFFTIKTIISCIVFIINPNYQFKLFTKKFFLISKKESKFLKDYRKTDTRLFPIYSNSTRQEILESNSDLQDEISEIKNTTYYSESFLDVLYEFLSAVFFTFITIVFLTILINDINFNKITILDKDTAYVEFRFKPNVVLDKNDIEEIEAEYYTTRTTGKHKRTIQNCMFIFTLDHQHPLSYQNFASKKNIESGEAYFYTYNYQRFPITLIYNSDVSLCPDRTYQDSKKEKSSIDYDRLIYKYKQ